jgi:phosphoribosylformylglycinamidine synthase PurS subunit
MRYKVKIEVSLKPGHSDPEGETTAKSLKELRYPVETVKVSKVYEVFLHAKSLKEVQKHVDEMCRRLLANPTKDNYRFDIEEVK